ncbi:hypothetical protein CPter291_4369 [Collimonas pratensis]|uniref:Uncharacterized protein n=1 Tax=Collimonas pratensis TaxID=279113 RepID=A0ABM5ZCD6_9BURK|nr:hypothetical protein CPter291_4369 [Collimonas pratensis]
MPAGSPQVMANTGRRCAPDSMAPDCSDMRSFQELTESRIAL